MVRLNEVRLRRVFIDWILVPAFAGINIRRMTKGMAGNAG